MMRSISGYVDVEIEVEDEQGNVVKKWVPGIEYLDMETGESVRQELTAFMKDQEKELNPFGY